MLFSDNRQQQKSLADVCLGTGGSTNSLYLTCRLEASIRQWQLQDGWSREIYARVCQSLAAWCTQPVLEARIDAWKVMFRRNC